MSRILAAPWFPLGLVAVVLLALYVATLCPTVGPGDSGELATALSTWGIPHPPGFPLLALLGNLFVHIPHPGEPAGMLNLMNALFAALACGVLAHAVWVLTGERWAGVVAGLVLGTSRVFWEYALVLEVFSLNALLAAALLDLWAIHRRGIESGAPAAWTVPAAAVVMAGIVTHHTTLVLIAAPVTVMFAIDLWRWREDGSKPKARAGAVERRNGSTRPRHPPRPLSPCGRGCWWPESRRWRPSFI